PLLDHVHDDLLAQAQEHRHLEHEGLVGLDQAGAAAHIAAALVGPPEPGFLVRPKQDDLLDLTHVIAKHATRSPLEYPSGRRAGLPQTRARRRPRPSPRRRWA